MTSFIDNAGWDRWLIQMEISNKYPIVSGIGVTNANFTELKTVTLIDEQLVNIYELARCPVGQEKRIDARDSDET